MRLIKTLCFALLPFLSSAIIEKDAGKNDWNIQNLGHVQDVKFVHDSDLAYIISKDGLLSLFDLSTQSFFWKKKLNQEVDVEG